MIPRPLRTVLIGFGKVAESYSTDPLTARYFPYSTHAQVLAEHPLFDWQAVVDSSEAALRRARQHWNIPYAFSDLREVTALWPPEVAVIATPPHRRLEFLPHLPDLRAVLVEKPLGVDLDSGGEFLAQCQQRGILVQVNYWRRADACFRQLAAGGLHQLIGAPQAVFGLYGNGLLNNAAHLIDFLRLLLGEVETAQALGEARPVPTGPTPENVNVPFVLRFQPGCSATFQTLSFSHYRENGLDLWGEKGRLAILQEGLGIYYYPRQANRALLNEREVASDRPQELQNTAGTAFYRMYDNLTAALHGGEALWSPGDSALATARVVEAVLTSATQGGLPVELSLPLAA